MLAHVGITRVTTLPGVWISVARLRRWCVQARLGGPLALEWASVGIQPVRVNLVETVSSSI